MNNFLLKTKNLFEEILQNVQLHSKNVHLVMGNTACDLDSCVSSLVLAWMKNNTQVASVPSLYVPILNIKEKELRLRTEITFLLKHLNIHSNNFVFRDHFSIEQLLNSQNVGISLVDHHVLLSSDKDLSKHVIEIIDHRIKTRDIPDHVNTNIALVGSCATLIAEMMLSSASSPIPEEIHTLLLGAILIDTNNLSAHAGKATLRDIDVVKRLKVGKSDSDLDSLYTDLINAKFAVNGLTTLDLLLKDAKWIEGPIYKAMFSTIHQILQNFVSFGDCETEISAYCKQHNATAWIGLFPELTENETAAKPLLLWCQCASLKSKIAEELVLQSDLKMELQMNGERLLSDNFAFLRMMNVQKTRKQILPVVDNLFQKFSSNDR